MKRLPTKPCSEMTDEELAEFLELGAWRENSISQDKTAYAEAARRAFVLNEHGQPRKDS